MTQDLLYHQLTTVRNAAFEAYHNQQVTQAASLFQQALEIAQGLNIKGEILRMQFWYSFMLQLNGALRRTLSMQADLLQADGLANDPSVSPGDIFNILTSYIEVGLQLPVSLPALEKLLKRGDAYLHSVGHPEWRPMLLHLQAELATLRGDFATALASAQEGWATWRDTYPYYTADTHLARLVELACLCREGEAALAWLAVWQSAPSNLQPHYRRSQIVRYQSWIARLQGCYQDAVDYARYYKHLVSGFSGRVDMAEIAPYIHACLAGDDLTAAGQELSRLGMARRSESLHDAYLLCLLLGDYHLGVARREAGLPAIDITLISGEVGRLPRQRAESGAVRRARWAYLRADKIGRRVDDLLTCTYRQEQTAIRLRLVASA